MKQYVKIFGCAGFICALLIALLLGCEPMFRLVAGWDVPEILDIGFYTALLTVGTLLLWTCRVHREGRLKSIVANALWVSAAVLVWLMWCAYVLSVLLMPLAEQPKALFDLGSQHVAFMWKDRGADTLMDLGFLLLAMLMSWRFKGKRAVALKGVLGVACLTELLRALAALIAFWLGTDRLSMLASFEFATMSLYELVGMTALMASELLICGVLAWRTYAKKHLPKKQFSQVVAVASVVFIIAVMFQFADTWSLPLTGFYTSYKIWVNGVAIGLGLLCSACMGIAAFAWYYQKSVGGDTHQSSAEE